MRIPIVEKAPADALIGLREAAPTGRGGRWRWRRVRAGRDGWRGGHGPADIGQHPQRDRPGVVIGLAATQARRHQRVRVARWIRGVVKVRHARSALERVRGVEARGAAARRRRRGAAEIERAALHRPRQRGGVVRVAGRVDQAAAARVGDKLVEDHRVAILAPAADPGGDVEAIEDPQAVPQFVQDDGGEVVLAGRRLAAAEIPGDPVAAELGDDIRVVRARVATLQLLRQRGRVPGVGGGVAGEAVRCRAAEDPAPQARVARADADRLRRDQERLPDIDRRLERGLRLGGEPVVLDRDRRRLRPQLGRLARRRDERPHFRVVGVDDRRRPAEPDPIPIGRCRAGWHAAADRGERGQHHHDSEEPPPSHHSPLITRHAAFITRHHTRRHTIRKPAFAHRTSQTGREFAGGRVRRMARAARRQLHLSAALNVLAARLFVKG